MILVKWGNTMAVSYIFLLKSSMVEECPIETIFGP